MRADNTRHIIATAQRHHELTRAKAIQTLRTLDSEAPESLSKPWPKRQRFHDPGSTPNPTSGPRSNAFALSAAGHRRPKCPSGNGQALLKGHHMRPKLGATKSTLEYHRSRAQPGWLPKKKFAKPGRCGKIACVNPAQLVMPSDAPSYGDVRLRAFEERDADMLMDLSTDAYVPMIGSLPRNASREDALADIERQLNRLDTGAGYSFCVADKDTDEALGTAGLHLPPIAAGRATAGYSVAPRNRGRRVAGQALTALTQFAWSIPQLFRVELYIEPWNSASVRTAEIAGYELEGLLRSYQEIGGKRVDMLLYATIRQGGQPFLKPASAAR